MALNKYLVFGHSMCICNERKHHFHLDENYKITTLHKPGKKNYKSN